MSSENRQIVPVGALVYKVRQFLENHVRLDGLQISGELSNLRNVRGHLYFDLKDENGQIHCTMWNTRARSLTFQPADGMEVLVTGAISVYEKRGDLQLQIYSMAQSGIGALYAELERRKKLLESQGYFDPAHKKPKPDWIESIGIVTGKGTAALQDALKTIRERWPMLKVTLYPASVQGPKAPDEIVEALIEADKKHHDAILLIRGGGSMEDLFCFNDPKIVKQLYNMATYTVSGIGHEIDTTLADFAADHRAVTPTAAAQWVTPDQRIILQNIEAFRQNMVHSMNRTLESASRQLLGILQNPWLSDPMKWIESTSMQLNRLTDALSYQSSHLLQPLMSDLVMQRQSMENAMNRMLQQKETGVTSARNALLIHSPMSMMALEEQKLDNMRRQMSREMTLLEQNSRRELEKLSALLKAGSPEAILDRGYAMITHEDRVVSSVDELALSDTIGIQMKGGKATAIIEGITLQGD